MQPPNPTLGISQNAEQYLRRMATALTEVEAQVASFQNAGYVTKAGVTPAVDTSAIQKALQANGSAPLNVTSLVGVLSQPQQAGAPTVSSLPVYNSPLAQGGSLVIFNGLLYYYNQANLPGVWTTVASSGILAQGTHAARITTPYTPPTNYPDGSLFYETDRTLLYVTRGGVWHYLEGVFSTSYASIAGLGLGTTDSGLRLFVNDYDHELKWAGSLWGWAEGDRQGGYIEAFQVDPDNLSTGWHPCDGTATTWLKITTGVLSIPALTTDNLIGGVAYLKYGSAATGIHGSVGPTYSGGANTGSSPTGDSVTSRTDVAVTGAGTAVETFTPAAGHTHTVPTINGDGEPIHVVYKPWFRR